MSAQPIQHASGFDPLAEFYGMWNTRLAERYLPMPELFGAAKYECDGGRLIVSPCESVENSRVEMKLGRLLFDAAEQAGLFLTARVNLAFGQQDWIEPDINVLAKETSGIWVPAELLVMPIELVSPSSRRNDLFDKPARCARAGIPYFMTVEARPSTGEVTVRQQKLDVRTGAYRLFAEATSGQAFTMTEPFEVSFDPAVLLH